MLRRTMGLTLLALAAMGGSAAAQAFGAGPPGTPRGSSFAGARIVGAPAKPSGRAIPNARIFGDEADERAFGRDVDDTALTPPIRRGIDQGTSNEERAAEGRSAIDPGRAGAFARQGPSAIGKSAVTRGRSFGGSRGGRARIVLPAK